LPAQKDAADSVHVALWLGEGKKLGKKRVFTPEPKSAFIWRIELLGAAWSIPRSSPPFDERRVTNGLELPTTLRRSAASPSAWASSGSP